MPCLLPNVQYVLHELALTVAVPRLPIEVSTACTTRTYSDGPGLRADGQYVLHELTLMAGAPRLASAVILTMSVGNFWV